MSASLVGSEMCIRDRFRSAPSVLRGRALRGGRAPPTSPFGLVGARPAPRHPAGAPGPRTS
eukprot:7445906-Alexandrium_andersonii.AAC.1